MTNENYFNFSNLNQKTFTNEQERIKEFEIYRNKLLKNNAPDLLLNNLDFIPYPQSESINQEKDLFDYQIFNKFEKYKCLRCDKIYEKKNLLIKHVKKLHHTNVSETIKCNFKGCGKEYYNLSTLKAHMKIHLNTFQCRFCNKNFSFKSSNFI